MLCAHAKNMYELMIPEDFDVQLTQALDELSGKSRGSDFKYRH